MAWLVERGTSAPAALVDGLRDRGWTVTTEQPDQLDAVLLLAGPHFPAEQLLTDAVLHGGWIDVSAVLPGDLMVLDLQPDRPFFVTRGCWLANSHGTEVSPKWGGMANLFGGEGGFGLQASGQGQVVL